jgi:hypothetical protein
MNLFRQPLTIQTWKGALRHAATVAKNQTTPDVVDGSNLKGWKEGKRGSVIVYAFPIVKGREEKIAYYTNSHLHTFSETTIPVPDTWWHKFTVTYPRKLADGWEREFGQAKQGWKQKLYKLGIAWTTENKRIPYSETFLKSLELAPPPPRIPVEHIDVHIYSTSTHPNLAQQIADAAVARLNHHKSRFYMSVALLPVSSLAGILPGPNVFLLYNGWRAWSHWKCLENVQALQKVISSGGLQVTNDARMSVLLPSEPISINSLTNQMTIHADSPTQDTVISEESIQLASKVLDLDGGVVHYLHKAKAQLTSS